jgi:hypothetical protein
MPFRSYWSSPWSSAMRPVLGSRLNRRSNRRQISPEEPLKRRSCPSRLAQPYSHLTSCSPLIQVSLPDPPSS